MKEFKITKEKILAMTEECEEAKAVLKKGFPEAFTVPAKIVKWEDITNELKLEMDDFGGERHFIRLSHDDEVIAYTGSNSIGTSELKLSEFGQAGDYKLEVDSSGDFTIFKKM